MNSVLSENLSYLHACDYDAFRQSIGDCVLEIENGVVTVEDISVYVSEILDNVPLLDVAARSSFIWLVGKIKLPIAWSLLHTIFPFVWSEKDADEVRQWLISYQDAIGSDVDKRDNEIFEKIASFAGSNIRVMKIFSRFNF